MYMYAMRPHVDRNGTPNEMKRSKTAAAYIYYARHGARRAAA